MISALLTATFIIVAAYFIWRDRHDELWDRLVDSFGTQRRSHRGSTTRRVLLIDIVSGKKMWMNGIHIYVDSEGIYLGMPILVGYKGHVLLPWAVTNSLSIEKHGLGLRAKFLVSSLDIAVSMPKRYRTDLESHISTKPLSSSAKSV